MTTRLIPIGAGGPPPTGRGEDFTRPRWVRPWWATSVGSIAVPALSRGWVVTGGPSLGTSTLVVGASTRPSDLAATEPTVRPSAQPSLAVSTAPPSAEPPQLRRAPPTRSARPAGPDATRVDRAEPAGLSIPRLALRVPIVATTLESDGQMARPDRPSETGWYAYGPTPGAGEGSAVLVERISKRALPVGDLLRPTGSPELRIITGGGPYDPSSGGYQDNVVVTARPR